MIEPRGGDKPKVALIGLGSMGTMLGRALAGAGHDLIVWNRTAERAEAFRDYAAIADDLASACARADLVLSCLSSYSATYSVLDHEDVREALAGKTLVQMSTATPDEALAFADWAARYGIGYLDAKIGVTPLQIGAAATVIFYAGARDLFDRHVSVLRCLGGRTTFMGEAPDRAVMGDFSFLSLYFPGIIGVLHGAAFCTAAGLDVEQYFDLTTSFLAEIAARCASFKEKLRHKNYRDVESALQTDLAGAMLLADTAQRLGLNPMFSNSLVALLQDSVDRGHGSLDTAALVDCFLKA